MDSLAFLDRASRASPEPIYVLHGDEDFLKRQVLAVLRKIVLGSDSDSFGLSTYPGDKAIFADIRSELETLPFVGPRRLLVVETAEPFVTANRAHLEKYFAAPASTATLVLDVKTWPANTRLAKSLGEKGTIVCKALPAYRLGGWCVKWMAAQHEKRLQSDAAELLVELVGTDMGQLDQEMTKLAAYVGSRDQVQLKDVDQLVGRSRAENIWQIFDAIGAGQTGAAIIILDRLFDQNEEPLRILGAFSMQLRRLVQVARLARQGQSFGQAMDSAGVPPFARRGLEQQLRHLGRERVDRLYDWLLEVDLGMKGSSQLPPRTLLERLVIRLAQPA
jgi:DNA polymerase-3 subunit delta